MDATTRHHNLLLNIRLAMRYHMWRQGFFERWHRITGVLSLVGGSAAVASIAAEDPHWALGLSALIALTQAVDLLVDTRKYADLHKDLRRRYCMIEPELLDKTSLDEAGYRNIREKILSIEVDEPPIKTVLMDICQNESWEVEGIDPLDPENARSFQKHPWYRRALAQVW